tara:strand:- start:614 stop:937 length:324 start_codon:yes stop_codon:yes gene_type:complete
MAVVRRVAQPRATVRKTTPDKPSVLSTRQPSRLEEMGDADFGTLDASKDGLVVVYDNAASNFILVTPDAILREAAQDQDISDEFVTQLETELDLADIVVDKIDGGAF